MRGTLAARLLADRAARRAAVTLALIALAVLLGPLLSPNSHDAMDFARIAAPPSLAGGHWFGTDSLGRDLLVRTLEGGRISLAVGLTATLVSLLVGVTWGAVAGWYGGRVDALMMRIVDVLYALPFMFFVILLMVFFGRDLVLMFVAIGAVRWLDMARIVRGQALSLREREFVQAAVALGASDARIVARHLIPNLLGVVVVYVTLTVPQVILVESFLSFLGLGVQEPATSWGMLVAEGAREMESAWWTLVFPAAFLALTLRALNALGDGLRDALDPSEAPHQEPRAADATREPGTAPQQVGTAPAVHAASAPSGAVPLLEVHDLTVRYGARTVVEGASFAVARGATLGIAGESGSGKSQLLLALTDLGAAGAEVEGRVCWQGTPLAAPARRALRGARIGYVFQDPLAALNPYLTVGAQLDEVLARHAGLAGDAARARAAELLEQVRVPEPAARLAAYPHQLSGGQRQRVMIAMALAGAPDLLLLDEPTTALDATVQAQVLALLAELQQRLGLTLVIVSHDLGVLAALADRMLVMRHGRVVEEGAAAGFYAAPRTGYARGLLEAARRLEAGVA
jgi:ABC-type dipeptide/oligopeptide/nickel transport system permease subunit/ABC-type dipeptide/oligopeptide/nickel transport system ATPase component